jgi:hypothetical protein
MPAAKAQAIFRGLMLIEADPAADANTLERIALWALTVYSPIVAVDGADGLVLDTEGADHLQGGEEPMLQGIANRFRSKKLTARVAIADTWGAAHACARAINRETVIVPQGEIVRAVEKLPLSLLRLPDKIVGDLRVLGFQTIGELANTARAPLALRFGPEIGRRLDQMFGRASEPIEPIRAPEWIEVSRSFAEPIGAAETINKYVGRLVVQLVAELQRKVHAEPSNRALNSHRPQGHCCTKRSRAAEIVDYLCTGICRISKIQEGSLAGKTFEPLELFVRGVVPAEYAIIVDHCHEATAAMIVLSRSTLNRWPS